MKDMSAFITTTTLCVLPAQVLETHFTPEAAERLQGEIESSIVMQQQQQQQQQQQFINRPSSRHEVLQTVLEEEEITSSGDKHFTLMSDMEAVHRELARVLTARNQSRQESDEDQYATSPSVDTDLQSRGPPPEIPPRPRAPLSPMITEEAPALPEIEDEDLNIFSMEELEEPVSSSSSVRSFGDFVEAPPSGTGVGQDFSRPSTSQGKKEVPHFPIIDDVLSEYEASLHSVDRDRRIEYLDDHEGLTSGDESRNGFSDGSICDSPATSVSSTNEDDIDAQSLDAGKESQQVDSGLVMEMGSKELSVHQKNSESVSSNTLPKRPVYIRGSSSRSSTARRAPKKNNGWKRVPKKARLSPGEKKRFVSRAFW
ncbi:hypothetical protein BDD12DRAFT_194824 [Trichophaea hybrida]|nr:hypothetical protein BDD12DRAFT_194824 [Trichophaea hybrida]